MVKKIEKIYLILGILNIIYSLFGFAILFYGMLNINYFFSKPNPNAPYIINTYYILPTISFILLSGLFVTGIFILKNNIKVIIFCNIIYILEILYIIIIFQFGWGWIGKQFPFLGLSVMLSSSLACISIFIQIITLYPVIALILLKKISNRIKKNG